ncbi:MFS-type transporter SLC18B1 [Tetranychus urticae]|uniref:Major facilitator superfamily (MFS) profile domain-containing protein n=1 Tax=Tetranychus urticae TaxID=32264 RepID=T1KA68_TETUR|nr:MFS-type transporter SLC18B1 [Tetranychus urticae]
MADESHAHHHHHHHHSHPHHHHYYDHSHHHLTHPHHHFIRSSGSVDLDPIEPLVMQNNFTIKRVESVARRLQVHAKLETRHDEEARLVVPSESITSEKSRLFTESLNNYQSIASSLGGLSVASSLGAGSKSQAHSVFTVSEENEKLLESSITSFESLIEQSNSPYNKLARNKIVLCLLTTGFSLYSVFSIIAPFYPQEAGHKGIPESIYGLVFSSHALTIILISPFIGKAIHRFEIKHLLMSGILLTGLSMILFGFLHYITNTILFGALSFGLRILGAIGFAVFHTAANIYITKLYPQSIGTVFGLVETFCGFGLSFGPMIGGGLYEWAGFPLPFWVLGTVNLLNIILYYYLIKPISEIVPEFDEHLSDDPDTPKLTYCKLLCNYKALVICAATIVISQNQTFLDPTVEPHLYNNGVKESSVALTFFLMNAAFALLSPIVGLISARINKYTLMSIGLLISGCSLISLGPPIFLPFDVNLQNSCISMVFMGIAYSLTLIPSFEALIEHAVEVDKFGNLQTFSLVAALYTAVFSLGEAIGPAFGGIFTQCFSFQLSTVLMGSITLFVAFITFMTRLCDQMH